MISDCSSIFKLNVVMRAYGNKMQSVICNMLEYMKHFLEYMISRLSQNVDEMDATLSSQLSEASEPERWHHVCITRERTRRTSQDGEFKEELTDEKVLHNLKID
ncbi:hypothetical protein M513_14218 [Trichuris suis]|uniref:Uncharacterized protein n=1 Tax=Trichuris suis TaxID=68888 RepID=A0A085LIV9_9BILA|nr:hypothetical protein M513_14218 [Trichuris suis]